MQFAPKAYRTTRVETTKQVELALKQTDNLRNITAEVLKTHPFILSMLRMATAPPIARDRLIGLAGVSPNLVGSMEIEKRIPPQMKGELANAELSKIGEIIIQLADQDIFTWFDSKKQPHQEEVHRAATIVADRLCGTVADPIIRNAQEKRQLASLKEWLEKRGYTYFESHQGIDWVWEHRIDDLKKLGL